MSKKAAQATTNPTGKARPEAKTPRGAGNDGAEPLLCEVAWEVCQQLGGIYTVIRSKVPCMVKRWGLRYVLVGAYNPSTTPAEFEACPPDGPAGEAVTRLRDMGFEVHYGTWLITGRPRAVLLNPRSVSDRLSDIKYALWEHHRISLPGDDSLIDDVVAFGFLVGQFFRALTGTPGAGRPVIGHFHEWMAGSAIPELRRSGLPMAIVFTTHATQVGRAMAANDPTFYDRLPTVDRLDTARRYAVEPKAELERAAAHGAHVFTTLSDITAYECEHLLGRKPDMLLPNGLNIERFVAIHEFQNLHRQYKEQIHQFVMAHFFPSYTFDLDRTLYVFSAGRYEPRNKGYDLVIEALARLNREMKRAGTDRTVVLFLVTKRPFKSINPDVLRSRAVMEEMRRNCDQIKDQVGERLFTATAAGRTPDFNSLADETLLLRLRRVTHAWKTRRLPRIVTHDLLDEADDVLQAIHGAMLFNVADDPVKVVYHPDFITSSDALFGMDYDQFVRGCHLGIFPSWYEPWGYTPLECVALGVPAITSDLAGFGTYLLEHVPDYEQRGLFVVRRRGRSDEDAVGDLTNHLVEFLKMDRRQRIAQRNRVESLAEHFGWKNLGRHYAEAHDMALERAGLAQ
ncbi:MAG TPA: glycogen synthase [Phycisphaerae bacterium]|nr:glycogen synthase [Phycisphaerae bacterium]